MRKGERPLRQLSRRLSRQSRIPLVVYGAVLGGMALIWALRAYLGDYTPDLLAELFGAAFTLFIVDTLLVRSRTKRWKAVRDHVDYLIAREVYRLRDGVATRVFGFAPDVDPSAPEEQNVALVLQQRAALLTEMEGLETDDLARRINEQKVFTEESYAYFNEKAQGLWSIVNMRYSEYLNPELISLLMNLHTGLEDAGASIRQYRKMERFAEDGAYYRAAGLEGMAGALRRILNLTARLKTEGYFEPALPAPSAGEAVGA